MKIALLAGVLSFVLPGAISAQAQLTTEASTGESQIFTRANDLGLDLWRAQDKFNARDFQGADAILRDAANQTMSAQVQLMAGLASAGVGDLNRARTHLRYALSLQPRYVDAKVVLAIVSKRLGDTETAIRLRDDIEARATACDSKCSSAASLARGAAALRKMI